MPFHTITLEKSGRVALITLNRPEHSNAVNEAMAQELREACQAVNEDDEIRVVILTGAGEAFCRGSELNLHRREETTGSSLDTMIKRHRVADAVAKVEKPTIAALNDDALGQGLELALACDLRIAQGEARLGLTQVKEGLIPWDGGTQRLPRLVGRARAMELLLTSRIVEAEEALSMGLVNQVVENALAQSKEVASAIAQHAPIAARYVKEAILKGLGLTLDQGLRLEADLNFLLHSTEDRPEGIRSFLEKRRPDFKGR
ncbi:MAG: enoyl-CoA hydratase/isomerase family protein [Chloroflexi bacterium]|nr:enoyl-CoA hydratase/isomerase family protein [Chloroflexota bacterium]